MYRDDRPVVLCEAGEPGESWGDGLLNGDLSISVFFTGDEMPVGRGPKSPSLKGSK